jgi:hypothetical protein
VRSPIDDVIEVFERWLILKDRTSVYAVLGAVAANLLPGGDPVWLGIIGPPSSGKTEMLVSLSRLPFVVHGSALTPASFLSATPKKDQDKEATGGLLRQIGAFGIIVLKDFTTMLSLRPEANAEVFAVLREVFDGRYTRHVATDGGRTLSWQGKAGLVFAATNDFDRHHAAITAMGDRSLLIRLAPLKDQYKRALEHTGEATQQMRNELAGAVARLFEAVKTISRDGLSSRKRSGLAVSSNWRCSCEPPSTEIGIHARSKSFTALKAQPGCSSVWSACSPGSIRWALIEKRRLWLLRGSPWIACHLFDDAPTSI